MTGEGRSRSWLRRAVCVVGRHRPGRGLPCPLCRYLWEPSEADTCAFVEEQLQGALEVHADLVARIDAVLDLCDRYQRDDLGGMESWINVREVRALLATESAGKGQS